MWGSRPLGFYAIPTALGVASAYYTWKPYMEEKRKEYDEHMKRKAEEEAKQKQLQDPTQQQQQDTATAVPAATVEQAKKKQELPNKL